MSHDDLGTKYWDAYEDSLAPPPGSAARNLARIRERIEAGEGIEPSRPQPHRRQAVAGAGAGVMMWSKAVAVTLGISMTAVVGLKLAVVAWTGTTATEPQEPATEPKAAATAPTSEKVTPSSPTPTVTPSPAEATPAPDSPAPTATTTPPRSGPSRAARNTTTLDTLRAEVTLMERARAALTRGDTTELSRLLRLHAERFPHGALTEEREAWRAVAACRKQSKDASSRASRFLREHPDSPQAARVRKECVPVRKVR